MELITTLGAWAFASVPSYTAGLFPGFFPHFTSNFFSSVEDSVTADLGSRLSQHAAIILPGSSQFASAIEFWQQYMVPHIAVVIEVATESDVQQTVSQLPLSVRRLSSTESFEDPARQQSQLILLSGIRWPWRY